MSLSKKVKISCLITLGILFTQIPMVDNNYVASVIISEKFLPHRDEFNQYSTNLSTSQITENTVRLTLKNSYVYDYPNTQSEWWGNAEAVMNPPNQSTDGFFVSRSAGGYYSNQKFGLLVRFNTLGNVEWFKTTSNALYPTAMVAALPNEKSVLGCYHYNYENIDFFSYNKNGDSIYNWSYDPLEDVKLVAMKWSNGLWAVGDIEAPTKGVFILKMDYSNGTILESSTWNLGLDTSVVGICSDNNGGLYLTGWILNNSKHNLFVAHSNSSGDITSSNIVYDEQFNVQGAACTYNGVNLYVVGPYQVEIGQDKSNTCVWNFDNNCTLQNFATITSEGKYGMDFYGKSTLSDMSWIYFNYDIKISNEGDLIVSDVIEKDYANTMIHLLDLSLNETDYYEYKTDSSASIYHDACGKLILTKYNKLFSVMFCNRVYSDHPYIRIVEYVKKTYENPIIIDGTATGHVAHNWSWAIAQDWCNGTGTYSNPYIIKNLIINGENSNSCVLIENSDVYFKIEDCEFFKSGVGIELFNSKNGNLLNNNCTLNYIGIYLEESDYNNISGNVVFNNPSVGIELSQSSHNNVSNNKVSYSSKGIFLCAWSDYNMVSENLLDYHSQGIDMYFESDFNQILRNKISNAYTGIAVQAGSDYNRISRNTIFATSQCITDYDQGYRNNIIEYNNCTITSNDGNGGNGDGHPIPPLNIGTIVIILALTILTIGVVIRAIRKQKKTKVKKLKLPKDEVARYKKLKELERMEMRVQDGFPDEIETDKTKISFCPFCNASLDDDWAYCKQCGSSIRRN